MSIGKIKRVFSVDLRINPDPLYKQGIQPSDFKQFHCFVACDNAQEAYEATLELGKEFLAKWGVEGFEVISIAQSYTDYRIVIKN